METMIKMLKRADILLMLFLLCLSFFPLVLRQETIPDAVYADIVLDGRLVRRVALSAHKGSETFSIAAPDGHQNILRLEGSTIAVIYADCPDQLCVKAGTAFRPGDVIACLPHKLMIEIKGNGAVTSSTDAAIR